MKAGKNIVYLIVGGVVAVILLAAAAVLSIGIGKLAMSQTQLDRRLGTWKDFYRKSPFPSMDNVKNVKEQTAIVSKWDVDLTTLLRKGQIDPSDRESPPAFKRMLEEKRNAMVGLAKTKGIGLPDKFAFGFGRYLASGNLPARENVPVLVQQLLTVEDLYKVLMECEIKDVVLIEREEFEGGSTGEGSPEPSGGASRRRGGGAASPAPAAPGAGAMPGMPAALPFGKPGAMDGEALYGRQHFTIDFKAKEPAVREVLNRLAGHNPIVVVTSIEMDADIPVYVAVRKSDKKTTDETSEEKPSLVKPKKSAGSLKLGDKDKKDAEATGEQGEGTEAKLPIEEKESEFRSERRVYGAPLMLPMKVRIELDVYRFKPAPPSPASGGTV